MLSRLISYCLNCVYFRYCDMILSREYLTFLLVYVYYAIHKSICYFEATVFSAVNFFNNFLCIIVYRYFNQYD